MKKFDESLTQAERDAPTFLEWPDSTIARCVRDLAKEIHNEKGDKAIFLQTAFQIIQSCMVETNAKTMNTTMTGDYGGKPYKFKMKAMLTNN